MRLLVLGSEGFIGSHCVDFFSSTHHFVSGIDLYEQPSKIYTYYKVSRLSPELEELFSKNTFDAVINASGSGNVPYSMTHPVIDFEANSLDTIRILDAIRKHQPSCKYLHISSAAVYGNPVRLPVHEDDLKRPLSPYGWHKLIAEQLCLEYSSLYQLNIAIMRPFSVYGEGLKKQLFWDLRQKMLTAKNAVELHGTGSESRDFIHVKDLVLAVSAILERSNLNGEVYNIASGVEVTIAQAIEVFMEAMGLKVPYYFNGVVRTGDPLNWRADIQKLNSLGFKADYTLQTGLECVANWFKTV